MSYAGRPVDGVLHDRGPHSGGRELDLSRGAAEYLGLTHAGVDHAQKDSAEASHDDGSGGEAAPGGPYVVQSGDTLTGIAAELWIDVDSLMAANGPADPDVVYAGQTLAYWGRRSLLQRA